MLLFLFLLLELISTSEAWNPGTSFKNRFGFAAVKSNGSVVTWGGSYYGGDSSGVAANLTSGVTTIYSTDGAFAAVKSDGSVITWGDSYAGGDSSGVAANLVNVDIVFGTTIHRSLSIYPHDYFMVTSTSLPTSQPTSQQQVSLQVSL